MSKKVLIVERSLAVRGIAESLLRQNGYEVLAAENSAAAREILHGSKIDLLIVASDIADKNEGRFFESLGNDNATAIIPLLILHDQTEGELAYPPEAIIGKPFTPREFLDKVSVFTGSQGVPVTTETSPFADSDLEDDLIDAALGLDKLDVDESEIMGNDTDVYRKQNQKVTPESMIGYEFKAQTDDATTSSKKIEQVNVPSDNAPSGTKTSRPGENKSDEFLGNDSNKVRRRPAETLSESSKIEIISDQYGMIVPPDEAESDISGKTHDYDWFVNELQKEGPAADPASDSGSLAISPNSEGMEPVTKPTASVTPPVPAEESVKSHNEAVDQFISEFKKEMEKISHEAVPDIPVTSIAPEETPVREKQVPSKSTLAWEDAVEKLTPDLMQAFSRELIEAVSEKVAAQIISRLDPENVYKVLKDCFFELRDKKYKA